MHMPQMDSVKESYRGGLLVVLRLWYSHLLRLYTVFTTAKVVKIRVVWEFFASKLCRFGILEYFCTRMMKSAVCR